MAACESDETIPTLTITNEELQKRTEQITSGDHQPDGIARKCSPPIRKDERSTPGLLHLSPTTVVNTNKEAERKTKRTRGRTRQEETSRPPKLSANSIRQEGRRNHSAVSSDAYLPKRRTTEQPVGDPARHKGPSHRASNHEEKQGGKETDLKSDDGLKAEWGRHENRKIERALAKWHGDAAKLDSVIQAW